jgi:sugar O-acyltransferase (sialic acid O-acetyltransferase NeuD family)
MLRSPFKQLVARYSKSDLVPDIVLLGIDSDLVSELGQNRILGYIAPEVHPRETRLIFLGSDEVINEFVENSIFYFGFDKPLTRRKYLDSFNLRGRSFESSNAIVDSTATIGEGTTIALFSFVGPQVKIGDFCKVNVRASIHHDVTIGSCSVIGPNVTVCGNVGIGRSVMVGAGATILPGIKVGDNVVIGAGAVVTRSVESNQTVVGIPARIR